MAKALRFNNLTLPDIAFDVAADRISAPLLLIAGDQDEVSVTQSQAMFSALYRQGKDTQLITYWGERHLISSPANLRDLYVRAFDWLGRTLTPAAGSPRE
ncbi:MAG: prolyl oligopeptidase family serine peptidase [Phenylobacterium sp.]|uniref:alpha/beta hydrolase family protein n=1 Tax=Phenylobacterium sp. TaxID=1871053 RepID=UPI002735D5D7|nr:prolyl oligopeptidase family serine peptidase [Phenylobacterium sp.]MDP3748643.1 prolyl oligopeptidase family serine peptidase [Phenylobacterium sp.]